MQKWEAICWQMVWNNPEFDAIWIKKNVVQYATIFYFLNHGCPMCEFEFLKKLYYILKEKNNLKKHWTDWSGWRMAEAMHDIILTVIRTTIQGANFFFKSANEVIIVDNQ